MEENSWCKFHTLITGNLPDDNVKNWNLKFKF